MLLIFFLLERLPYADCFSTLNLGATGAIHPGFSHDSLPDMLYQKKLLKFSRQQYLSTWSIDNLWGQAYRRTANATALPIAPKEKGLDRMTKTLSSKCAGHAI